ncbi:MAG: acyltransferase [Lachnospiraceae bacterium]|nr:acyltransferase [Lachnospiraceae bacterium]
MNAEFFAGSSGCSFGKCKRKCEIVKGKEQGNMEERKYIKSFDSLKGIVVLLTCTIGHYWQFTPAGYWCEGKNAWFTALTNAVTHFSFKRTFTLMELLLMISGFQLFYQYEKIAENRIGFGNYIKKRMVRLFPMTILSTVVMVAGLWYYHSLTGELWYKTEIKAGYIIENLLNIQVWGKSFHTLNGPLWYVSVYFFCCILYFVLVKLGEKLKVKYFIMAVPVVLAILLKGKGLNIVLLNADMCRGYIGFFAGVLVAGIVKHAEKKKLCYFSLALLAGYVVFYSVCKEFIYAGPVLNKVLPAVLFFYAPLLILLSQNRVVDGIVGNKVLAGLGKISYSLYVWNFPFYVWLAAIENRFQLHIPYGEAYMYWLMAIAQILLAACSYLWIEKPIYKCVAAVGCRKEHKRSA